MLYKKNVSHFITSLKPGVSVSYLMNLVMAVVFAQTATSAALAKPIQQISLAQAAMLSVQPTVATPFYLKYNHDEATLKKIKAALTNRLKKVKPVDADKIVKYLAYIQLTPDKADFKMLTGRLFDSSMQFILCDDVTDWECLESKPKVNPTSLGRTDVEQELGRPVMAGDTLDIEHFFTQGWYENHIHKNKKNIILNTTVAEILAGKIKDEGQKNLWIALYGIDDIEGSMSSVFKAIEEKVDAGVPTYGVVDIEEGNMPNSFMRDYNLVKNSKGTYTLETAKVNLDYAYVNPKDSYNAAFFAPGWAKNYLKDVQKLMNLESKSQVKQYLLKDYFEFPKDTKTNFSTLIGDLTWIAINKNLKDHESSLQRAAFQYSNNIDFMRLLNKNSSINSESKARAEFPFKGIMHNKFVVFENNKNEKSVWTGTANISQTCMGDESNANLSIFIKNNLIAEAFQQEFLEMFEESKEKGKPETLLTGKFHNRKRPNTQRYFTFKDGTEVRIHFSPTDDAEHRVLLPMIYSAKRGDILRISMFGGGGHEYVRALQTAYSQGVDVRIVFDKLTGSGLNSWWRDQSANLLEKSPYTKPGAEKVVGKIEVRKNTWIGLNHHKTATLSRAQVNGSQRSEILVVGSQNWSQTGNDLNDENMVTIRNTEKSLSAMDDFNKEFDERLWPLSTNVETAE